MTNQTTGSVLLAPSPAGTNYDLMYYVKGAAAGGICCSITHGALTPVDVVKTRVQLDPIKVSSSELLKNVGTILPCAIIPLLSCHKIFARHKISYFFDY
jgi:Mitochondrial carrier protein